MVDIRWYGIDAHYEGVGKLVGEEQTSFQYVLQVHFISFFLLHINNNIWWRREKFDIQNERKN